MKSKKTMTTTMEKRNWNDDNHQSERNLDFQVVYFEKSLVLL